MAKRMLIDAAHPEETRVVVLSGNRLEEFDFETSTKKQIKGNIYLAKVTRVEPSLQAAFVEYGGNRHGFLAFSEIHPDYYRIPVADRQAALAADRDAEREAEEREEAMADAPAATHMALEARADEIRSAERYGGEDPAGEDPAGEDPGAAAASATVDQDGGAGESGWEPEASTASGTAEEPQAGDLAPLGEGVTEAFAEAEHHALADGQADGHEAAPADGAPAESRGSIEEAPHRPTVIETVGGDEIEETTRQRARPHRHYKIQEVIKRRQIMLVQVTKEERGNKGAALTTYLSLAGRYCVLMPNTPRGGGVSRKITSATDRRRLKELVGDLDVPEGMGVIVRTAGSERSKAEIKRDFEYLIRLWDEIRELTLRSTAPALIYEEGNLIKRSIRDLYTRDIEEVIVDGEEGYRTAKAFMKMLMPSHAKRVKPYRDPSVPLFHRFQVEGQIDAIHSPVVQLRSGGYIVINPTEALVAIDVNSGRSTKERNIEETALKTNIEAAEEVARQLRLRDLAGLIVIDFIDMEEGRNQAAVERRLKEAMRHDRARIQLGRISPFGLLELSRQRLRPSLLEASTQICPHCNGSGHIRSTESTALHVLRAIEEEGMRRRSAEVSVAVPTTVALYILNQKRDALQQTEGRYGFRVAVTNDDTLIPPAFRLERLRALTPAELAALPTLVAAPLEAEDEDEEEEEERLEEEERAEGEAAAAERDEGEDGQGRRRRRRRRRGRREDDHEEAGEAPAERHVEPEAAEAGTEASEEIETAPALAEGHVEESAEGEATGDLDENGRKRRRRGRRGGRRRRRGGPEGVPGEGEGEGNGEAATAEAGAPEAESVEYLPERWESEDAGEDMAVALEATPAPRAAAVATESVPVTDRGDMAAARLTAEPAEVAQAAQPPEAPPEAPAASPESAASAEPQATSPAPPEPTRSPTVPEPEHEPERQPVAYNVSPAHEITSRPANPRRGWWSRG